MRILDRFYVFIGWAIVALGGLHMLANTSAFGIYSRVPALVLRFRYRDGFGDGTGVASKRSNICVVRWIASVSRMVVGL